MDQRNVDRLFAWLALQVEATYREEIDMAMDCFVEEEYTREELERFLEYVMERVPDADYDRVFDHVESELNKL